MSAQSAQGGSLAAVVLLFNIQKWAVIIITAFGGAGSTQAGPGLHRRSYFVAGHPHVRFFGTLSPMRIPWTLPFPAWGCRVYIQVNAILARK
ncbi:MAG: hypothetical protein U9R58_11665 [Chloroflexota bacterium]|nr:hypothetical protein [Chloroflexota bacterium]